MCTTCKDTCNCNKSPIPAWESGKEYKSFNGDRYTFIGLFMDRGVKKAAFHRDSIVLSNGVCVRNADGTHLRREFSEHDIINDEPTQEEREWASKIANALGNGTTAKLCRGEYVAHHATFPRNRAEKILKIVREIRNATR
jgi:hypothetical protein